MDRPDEPRDQDPYRENREDPYRTDSGFPPRQPLGGQEEIDERRQEEPRKRGGGRAFFLGLLGGILGALILIGAFYLLRDQILPQATDDAKVETAVTTSASEDDIVGAVQKTKEAVVSVTNLQSSLFSGNAEETGAGSGVIYKKDGDKAYVVTNNHVVEGASELSVTLADGTALDAKLLGADPTYDLAVLQIDSSKVKQVIELGDSDKLQAGETVLAIGNPLGVFANSVTRGVISAQERTVPVDTNKDGQEDFNTEVIQTDAAINPGNSGGALVNTRGQLVGINSMKIAEASVEGVGFAIPVNEALPVMRDLEKNGEVVRPQLGVQIRDINELPSGYLEEKLNLPDDVNNGLLVVGLTKNSGAADSGTKKRDVHVQINDTKINSFADLKSVLYREAKVGDEVTVIFYRDGSKERAKVKLSAQNAVQQ